MLMSSGRKSIRYVETYPILSEMVVGLKLAVWWSEGGLLKLVATVGLGISDFVYRIIALFVPVASGIDETPWFRDLIHGHGGRQRDSVPRGEHTHYFLYCNCSSVGSSLSESLSRYFVPPNNRRKRSLPTHIISRLYYSHKHVIFRY